MKFTHTHTQEGHEWERGVVTLVVHPFCPAGLYFHHLQLFVNHSGLVYRLCMEDKTCVITFLDKESMKDNAIRDAFHSLTGTSKDARNLPHGHTPIRKGSRRPLKTTPCTDSSDEGSYAKPNNYCSGIKESFLVSWEKLLCTPCNTACKSFQGC